MHLHRQSEIVMSTSHRIGHLPSPNRRLRSYSLFFSSALIALAFVVNGCASGTPGQPPTLQLSVSAQPPVGGVIPVLVKRDCTANCGISGTPLTRQQIVALNESGQYVPAMPLDEAIKLAGGTGNLLDAVNARESRASTIARESTFELQNTSGSVFAVFAVPFAVGSAASKASLSTEEVEEIRLREVAIPECPHTDVTHGCPISANLYALHHDPTLGGDHGWVFFPIGRYTRVQAYYNWLPSFSASENQTEVVEAALAAPSVSPVATLSSTDPPADSGSASAESAESQAR
jgi:hypothetical protein